MINARLSKLLKKCDEVIDIWDNIPKYPSASDEDEFVDEPDWTDLDVCYFGRFDLWDGFHSSDKPIVCPEIHIICKGGKNEKR